MADQVDRYEEGLVNKRGEKEIALLTAATNLINIITKDAKPVLVGS